MDKQQLLEFINLFREKAEKNKLIIFVGAGVSCNVEGMPSWYTLIQKMAQAIDYSKCSSCRLKSKCSEECLLIEDYSTDEFLKIPQYVFNKNHKKYRTVLKDNISDAVIDAPLSSAIFDINPVHIITTNYDKLIESSSSEFCKQYQVIVKDKDLLNSEKSKYIIKMHGDVTLPETIVLKEQDYLNYSQNHVLIELFLKSLLTDHTILFLGYSLNDYNIKLIISWLNYMRTKNKALAKDQKVGYIVLDDEKINNTQSAYFAGNNIGVINIKEMPLINDIPPLLSDARGQRLYSFLKTVSNPSFESILSSRDAIEYAVGFMIKYNFVDYTTLLKLIYIHQYEKTNTQLRLFNEKDYALLELFMSCNNKNSYQLKQLFINAGVEEILYGNSGHEKCFRIGDFLKSRLFSDELFLLYIQNKYDELALKLKDKECNAIDKYFYLSIIYGYSEAMTMYNSIAFSELSMDNRVVFLHNTAVLQALTNYSFDSRKVRHFIGNLALSKEKGMFSSYLEIYDGNSKKQLNMRNSLEKLKLDVTVKGTIHFGGISCSEIYKIKNDAMSQYFFYFLNHVFFKGFSDASIFLKTYIEAILCASSKQAEKPNDLWGMSFINNKYFVNKIDFDIITKFIASKDLFSLISTYKIARFKTSEENVLFLCHCFENLCYSLTKAKTYGFRQSSLTTLLNLAQVLKLVDLTDKNRSIVEDSLVTLLGEQSFAEIFFSTNSNDFQLSVKILADLCELLTFMPDISIIKNIINSDDFYSYAINVDFQCLRKIIMSFAKKELLVNKQNEIGDIIDVEAEFNKKIILLRLLYKCITNDGLKTKYVTFLSDNFSKLDTQSLYDFIFSDWIKPSIEEINIFLKGIINIYNQQKQGVHSIPDPVEMKLECAYILYIEEIIPNIGELNGLEEGRPHLQFLLNPNDFDYTQVDFSNYMWQNFARHDKYMKLFVEHKQNIIPGIEAKLKDDSAGEAEKKILYGFLLSGKELWNY